MYFSFFFVAANARDIQSLPYTKSLDLLMLMSGAGIIGRLVPNYFADRMGALTVFVPTAAIAAVVMCAWMAVKSVTGLYVWAAFNGIALGGIQSM